ncbi:MAG TPA: bifunctional diguanylate cyclase/phosphodiesterase [Solirubrobacteraceae bacterium]|nr:bifunctional diguanylate cyclase/phosphodiesterase [Solirubrobacteraceae bacterium]
MPTTAIRDLRATQNDRLTGLPNRQTLTAALTDLLAARGASGEIGALLLFDIDRFHRVNDVRGHEAGDELLRRVASGLRTWSDGRCTLARTGGNEFAVVLTAGAEEGVRAAACRARVLVSQFCGPDAPQFSVGIATFDRRDRWTVDALFKSASAALRDAKVDGCGLITSYRVGERHGVDGAAWVGQALAEDRLTLFAQPIVALQTGEVVRRELLVRALDTDGRLVMPGAFIPAAERFGLMPAIDRWVIARALILAAEGARLSINLSAQTLTDFAPLATMVASALSAGVDPNNMMFEITETAAIADQRVGFSALRALAELGCPLALDDFGAGFGCFSYLKHVPARVVKIDREFIRDISSNTTDFAITSAITGLAHELGIDVIAEGVEDPDGRAAVVSAGVRYAQGYLLGRPAAIEPGEATVFPR